MGTLKSNRKNEIETFQHLFDQSNIIFHTETFPDLAAEAEPSNAHWIMPQVKQVSSPSVCGLSPNQSPEERKIPNASFTIP